MVDEQSADLREQLVSSCRTSVGDRGAFVTTDELEMDPFRELASAVRSVLAESESGK